MILLVWTIFSCVKELSKMRRRLCKTYGIENKHIQRPIKEKICDLSCVDKEWSEIVLLMRPFQTCALVFIFMNEFSAKNANHWFVLFLILFTRSQHEVFIEASSFRENSMKNENVQMVWKYQTKIYCSSNKTFFVFFFSIFILNWLTLEINSTNLYDL